MIALYPGFKKFLILLTIGKYLEPLKQDISLLLKQYQNLSSLLDFFVAESKLGSFSDDLNSIFDGNPNNLDNLLIFQAVNNQIESTTERLESLIQEFPGLEKYKFVLSQNSRMDFLRIYFESLLERHAELENILKMIDENKTLDSLPLNLETILNSFSGLNNLLVMLTFGGNIRYFNQKLDSMPKEYPGLKKLLSSFVNHSDLEFLRSIIKSTLTENPNIEDLLTSNILKNMPDFSSINFEPIFKKHPQLKVVLAKIIEENGIGSSQKYLNHLLSQYPTLQALLKSSVTNDELRALPQNLKDIIDKYPNLERLLLTLTLASISPSLRPKINEILETNPGLRRLLVSFSADSELNFMDKCIQSILTKDPNVTHLLAINTDLERMGRETQILENARDRTSNHVNVSTENSNVRQTPFTPDGTVVLNQNPEELRTTTNEEVSNSLSSQNNELMSQQILSSNQLEFVADEGSKQEALSLQPISEIHLNEDFGSNDSLPQGDDPEVGENTFSEPNNGSQASSRRMKSMNNKDLTQKQSKKMLDNSKGEDKRAKLIIIKDNLKKKVVEKVNRKYKSGIDVGKNGDDSTNPDIKNDDYLDQQMGDDPSVFLSELKPVGDLLHQTHFIKPKNTNLEHFPVSPKKIFSEKNKEQYSEEHDSSKAHNPAYVSLIPVEKIAKNDFKEINSYNFQDDKPDIVYGEPQSSKNSDALLNFGSKKQTEETQSLINLTFTASRSDN